MILACHARASNVVGLPVSLYIYNPSVPFKPLPTQYSSEVCTKLCSFTKLGVREYTGRLSLTASTVSQLHASTLPLLLSAVAAAGKLEQVQCARSARA